MSDELKSIGIIGLGLIGGSLALALSREGYAVKGFVRDKSKYSNDLPFTIHDSYEELKNCEIVVIATHISAVRDILEQIKPYLAENVILTDVSSVKTSIEGSVREILGSEITFIPGHPMAGTEYSGFEHADADMFRDKPWVMAIENKTLRTIFESINAKVIILDSEEHDSYVSLISHLPMLLSCALKDIVEESHPEALSLASSGYESMTRLAGGNQQLNADLIEFNKDNLKQAWNEYKAIVDELLS